jgi:hypothetical protein
MKMSLEHLQQEPVSPGRVPSLEHLQRSLLAGSGEVNV